MPLRCSGFGQTLELCNEYCVITGTLYLLKAGQSVHDNGITTFGIPINGVLNDAGIFHVVTLFNPIKNVSVLNKFKTEITTLNKEAY